MPIKDRLSALQAVNPPFSKTSTQSIPIKLNDTKIEMSGVASLDRFFEQIETMNTMLDSMSVSIGKVKQKHSYILSMPGTDDRDKVELEELMENIKKSAQKVRTDLKIMEDEITADEAAGIISADLRIKKTQFSTVSRKFTSVMSDYNKVQTDYKDRCKSRIKRQLEITGRTHDDEQINQMLETGNPQIFTQGIIADSQLAKQALADVEARHEDIMKLENNIRELRDMFVDMALLVESQGEMIDRIEYNVLNAVEYVAQAKVETGQAVKYQSAARRKKICLIVTLILVVFVIVCAVAIPLAQKMDRTSGTATSPPIVPTVRPAITSTTHYNSTISP